MRQIVGGLIFAGLATGALAADYSFDPPPVVSSHHYYSILPECTDGAVLARVNDKFVYGDAHLTHTGLQIAGYDGIMQTALKAGGPGLIDRRYCVATATLSDGRLSEVVYLIEGPKVGPFSSSWHVESCLPGFDVYRVHDARCRSIRP